ncbi:TM2 domain-containing protein [Bacillus paralicheniformis]|uniref:TM2 domain-containing protein n=1 Tax=Bacillus TaxID=1386 RepID=UPI00273F9BB4|nr:TM2 domain-containing protein [Bacillus paralicheniformis]
MYFIGKKEAGYICERGQERSGFQNKKKPKLIVFLLWWFLGGVAAHRFYLDERKDCAVAMLLLCLVKTTDEVRNRV